MTKSTRVGEAEVMAVPEPAFTKTFHPTSHAKLITALDRAATSHGLAVKSKNYTLSENGARMFGTWMVDSGHSDRDWMLGFRNGLDKSMAAGVVAGNNIIVCSNMQFNGEYIAFSRHTSGLDMDRLLYMADKAIEVTLQKCLDFDVWHEEMKTIEMTRDDTKCFTFDAMRHGVFPPSKFKAFGEAVKEEYAISKECSLYTLHGGVTRLIRDTSLFNVADTSRKLVGLCDNYKIAKAA